MNWKFEVLLTWSWLTSFEFNEENWRFLQDFEDCKFGAPAKYPSTSAITLSRLLSIVETRDYSDTPKLPQRTLNTRVMKQHIIQNVKNKKNKNFTIFSESKHLKAYFSSRLYYKCVYCGYFFGRKSLHTLQELRNNYKS